MEANNNNTKLIVGMVLGGFLFFFYLLTRLLKKQERAPVANKPVQESAGAKNKDGARVSNKKRVNAWATGHSVTFSPSWQVAAMKGHTGQLLDVDYSSNGKYIASCGEEEGSCSGSNSSASSSSGSECGGKEQDDLDEEMPLEQASPTSKGLSRRQRKNRRRDDTSPKKQPAQLPTYELLREYVRLPIPESTFCNFLYSHLLTAEQLFTHGYPVPDENYKNRVVYFNSYGLRKQELQEKLQQELQKKEPKQKQRFDVNAREFVPRDTESSSSCSSTSSSDSENSENDAKLPPRRPEVVNGAEKTCTRCNAGFFVTRTDYLTQERCFYHWGRLIAYRYTCCQGRDGTPGCTTSKLHVWSGSDPGLNVRCGFVKTRSAKVPHYGGGVYALDCEMCYTVAGLEVTKVTVVAMDGRLVYDSYVQPLNEVIDYNTRFSGITAKDLQTTNVKTLRQVQNDLRGFISAETILIGHALNNDLCALKMVHMNVVDTAMSFPHPQGLPMRRSLKSLILHVLHRDIQCNEGGHDSYEDACACMELMLNKVGREYRGVL